jgi:outer membrane protease
MLSFKNAIYLMLEVYPEVSNLNEFEKILNNTRFKSSHDKNRATKDYKNLLEIRDKINLMLPKEHKDYDWLNKISETTNKKYHYLKTNYSEHYNFLDYYYSLYFDFKYNFNLSKSIDLSPSLSYEFLSLKFNAINGFYRYGVTNEYGNYIENYQTGTITYLDGDILSLTRNLNIIWLGFSTKFSATKKLDFIANFQICPFVYVDSIDFHVTRHSYFYDRMWGFFKGIQFEIKSYYNFTKNHSIALSFKFRNLNDINGDTYSSSDLNEAFVKNTSKSGSAFNFINLSLSYRYRFK